MGSVVKAKVVDIEENRREGRSMRMRKEVVGCLQAVVGKHIFLFKLLYGQKKDMSSSLLVFLSSKDYNKMDEPVSNSSEKY